MKSGNYCIMRDNPLLKYSLRRIMDERRLSYSEVGEEIGVPKQNIYSYFKDENKKGLTQLQLLAMCELFGIKVNLKIEFT